jgi:predicted dehydrogenase
VLPREFGLPATTNYQELLAAKEVDLIVDVTGDPAVARVIHKLKADGTEVSGGGGLSHTLLGG